MTSLTGQLKNSMKFKKIAITGHTKGIGNGLHTYFSSQPVEVIGFSRTNNYDISNIDIVDKIIDETMDCEIFINNAYYENHQSIIASKWFEKHKNHNHLLVNISSIAPIANQYIDKKFVHIKYGEFKSDLDKVSWDINFSNCTARCIIINPALVETNMAHPGYIEKFKKNETVISVKEISNLIVDLINLYFNNRWYIPQVYLINNDDFT